MRALVCGAGGFIGGHLVSRLVREGMYYDDGVTRSIYDKVIAVDKKPLSQWYQPHRHSQVHNLCLDLADFENCQRACEGVDHVFQLAADMGGMGFIEKYRIECMRSVLINVHMLEAAYRAGAHKYFFSSSACVYNTDLQTDESSSIKLEEGNAYPAKAERGYGWEKLYSEMLCQEYTAERKMPTYIARFHNVYGPWGTWDGGREKAPAALCRKVAEIIGSVRSGNASIKISVWGNGKQRRSYMYIRDCIEGIMRIISEPKLVATPINLGSSESVSVDELLGIITSIANVKVEPVYDLYAPKGVGSRNSDNTLIKEVLEWEPTTTLKQGLVPTYEWIENQVQLRKSGKSVVL